MVDTSKHPILVQCVELCYAIEELDAGEKQTAAISKATALTEAVEKLVDVDKELKNSWNKFHSMERAIGLLECRAHAEKAISEAAKLHSDTLANTVRLILPLAKGYAAEHRLPINDEVVRFAEGFLEPIKD